MHNKQTKWATDMDTCRYYKTTGFENGLDNKPRFKYIIRIF